MDDPERFWSRVDVGHPLGCWEWMARKDPAGYGRFDWKKEGSARAFPGLAHRFAYANVMGEEPNTLDHLCENRSCVNPDHLLPTTRGENVARSLTGRRQPADVVARRTEAIRRNWPLKPHGTGTRYRSGCRCRPCKSANAKRSRDTRKRLARVSNHGCEVTGELAPGGTGLPVMA